MNKIFLTKKVAARLSKGHQWIFDNEIAIKEGDLSHGDLVSVFTHTGSYLGVGFYNSLSKISVRLLTKAEQDFDFKSFFQKALIRAATWRQNVCGEQTAYRVFHSESDGVSGLYIDRFHDTFIVQMLTQGLELRTNDILDVIKSQFGQGIKVIIDQSNNLRKYEKLEVKSALNEDVEVDFLGYRSYYRNKSSVQLDRVEMYEFIKQISHDKKVWDLCCGSGHFSLNAYLGGASTIVALDNDEKMVNEMKQNVKLNSFEPAKFITIQDNVFDWLSASESDEAKPDVVVLDPPAFNIQKNDLAPYKDLVIKCFKKINNDGIMLVGYQSSKIKTEDFLNMLMDSSVESKRAHVLLKYFQHPIHMPIDLLYEHSDHLHFWAIKIA